MGADRRTEETGRELPAPDASLVLIRTGAQAIVKVLGRKKGERFLREWAKLLADEESVHLLFPTRPRAERGAVTVAQREAVAWMKQALPVLMASVPPE